jgi:hypothetical protein
MKRKRETETEDETHESKHMLRQLKDMPQVLLSKSFSYLTGPTRQAISLVCKSWFELEKSQLSWPNILSFHVPSWGLDDLGRK